MPSSTQPYNVYSCGPISAGKAGSYQCGKILPPRLFHLTTLELIYKYTQFLMVLHMQSISLLW